MCLRMYVGVYVCMYVCMYACMHACMHVPTQLNLSCSVIFGFHYIKTFYYVESNLFRITRDHRLYVWGHPSNRKLGHAGFNHDGTEVRSLADWTRCHELPLLLLLLLLRAIATTVCPLGR